MQEKEDKKPKKESNKKELIQKGLLGFLIALLLCCGVYAGITAYVRSAGDAELPVYSKKEGKEEQAEDKDSVDSVVSESEEVTYNKTTINSNPSSSITVGSAGDESIAGVSNPNSSNSAVITLLTKGVRFVQIVYPKGDNGAKVAAQNLSDTLAKKAGYQLTVVPDSTKETTYEVLVGETNREESAATLAYMIQKKGSYAVQTTTEKIVLAGNTVTALNKAVTYTVSLANTAKGQATIAKNTSYAWKSSNSYHNTILSSTSVAATTKKAYDINESNANGIAQGGCYDGKYFYQLFLTKQVTSDESQNDCKIVKIDMSTGKKVKVSGKLALYHGNDITYNSKLNCLVVCHNAPNRYTVSYVNPDTLKITKTFQIGYEIYCIDYNAATNRYVVGLSGGQTFRILDSDFNAVGKVNMPVDETKKHTTQGCGSDDEFIYFALHMSGGKSVITVFDWDGNYVSTISLSGTTIGNREVENVCVINGEMYISCASLTWTYAELYKITDLKTQ